MLPWKQRKRHILPVDNIFYQYIFHLPTFSLWAATFLLPWFDEWHILTNCQNRVQPPWKVNLRCLRAYSITFNSSNVGNFFWSWILKDCIKVEEKKKKVIVRLLPPSTKREIRQFHVVVAQRRQRNVQKSLMHVQSYCFACLNLLLFCCIRCYRRRGWVNFLISIPSHLHFGE